MSNERDELFQLILGRTTTKAVERILAAGYRKPRTIMSAEELEALPAGSVIRDDDDRLWEWVHVGYGGVDKALSAMGIGSMLAPVAFRHYPATVIFEGDAA